ncbi:MAG: hypothetical protein RR431_04410 [Clostridia bacterium]
MKKSICVLLLGLLLVASSVNAQETQRYSIGEVREQAAEGWHENYTAHGREILVDMDVFTPDVDFMPIQKVKLARMGPAFTESETGWDILVREDTNYLRYRTKDYPELIPGKLDRLPDAVYVNPKEKDKAYALFSEMTLGEAIHYIKQTFELARMNADDFLIERPYLLRTFKYINPKTKETILPGDYYLFFYQCLNKIPILCHAGEALRAKTHLRYAPLLTAWINSEENYEVAIQKMDSVAVIAEDIPLCPFSTIKNAIETEIAAGHIRSAFDLELGYALYDDPDMAETNDIADCYYAVPAWRLNCLYLDNPRKELPPYDAQRSFSVDSLEYVTILFDAQTGEMQDLGTQKKRIYYDGFIPWDEVND